MISWVSLLIYIYNDTNKLMSSSIQVEELVEYYKQEAGSLPCKLFLAAARDTPPDQEQGGGVKPGGGGGARPGGGGKFCAKRRKKNIEVEEMLIVNRES